MQVCHSDVTPFVSHENVRCQNNNCRRSIVPVPRSRSAERALCPELLTLWFCTFHWTISCLHVEFDMFQITTMANFETEVYEFLNLFSLVQASSRYCRDSHNFLTFLTTRLPISWFLGKYHSEMKCFFC